MYGTYKEAAQRQDILKEPREGNQIGTSGLQIRSASRSQFPMSVVHTFVTQFCFLRRGSYIP